MIASILVRNFRSIDRQDVACNWITTFVGENDAGKSNFLRALNLFFNDQTDPDTPFNFERDFNKFASVGKQKARQIEIRIRFFLPSGYRRKNYPDEIEWVKIWRESGILVDKGYRRYVNGAAFPSRSKIPALLDRIRFTYVPAIKDQRFFLDLQGQLYDVLASVAAAPLKESAANFEEQLQSQLKELLASINFAFDEDSTLRLPEDLRSIFERLEISTNGIPLSRRGDGIKIRHIPMILNFIAEKHDNILNRGGVRYTHIWGFEEPENSVEMSACFEMAKQFLEIIAKDDRHQLFLTTHSPIIYAMEDPGEVDPADEAWLYRYFVEKRENFSVITRRALPDVHESMGLMPLIAPHIEQAKKEQDRLRQELRAAKTIADRRLPTIFLEGETDRIVINKAIQIFAQDFEDKLFLQAGGVNEYGSANALASRSLAWALEMRHRRQEARVKALAVFDGDGEGRKANRRVREDLRKLGIQRGPDFRTKVLDTPPNLRKLKQAQFELPIDLEAYLDDTVWEVAETKGWLEDVEDPRAGLSDNMVKTFFDTLVDPREALNPAERRRLQKRFTVQGKRRAAQYVAGLAEEKASVALDQFEALVKEIVDYFFPEKKENDG